MTTPDLANAIGRTTIIVDTPSTRLAEQYRATLAPHLSETGDAAPLMLHWCLGTPDAPTPELDRDGHPRRGGFLPAVPLPRRMWAGGELRFEAPLALDRPVTRRSRIADLVDKSGKRGPMMLLTVAHELEQDGRVAIRERQDIVYLEMTAAPATPPPEERRAAAAADMVEASPPLLFRYSALTFNAHRIHYDLAYATGVEGYPSLVVHGPLQATLIANLAARHAGRPPARMAYRGRSPLIAGAPFRVAVADGDGELDGWTEDGDGRVCMTAHFDFA